MGAAGEAVQTCTLTDKRALSPTPGLLSLHYSHAQVPARLMNQPLSRHVAVTHILALGGKVMLT